MCRTAPCGAWEGRMPSPRKAPPLPMRRRGRCHVPCASATRRPGRGGNSKGRPHVSEDRAPSRFPVPNPVPHAPRRLRSLSNLGDARAFGGKAFCLPTRRKARFVRTRCVHQWRACRRVRGRDALAPKGPSLRAGSSNYQHVTKPVPYEGRRLALVGGFHKEPARRHNRGYGHRCADAAGLHGCH